MIYFSFSITNISYQKHVGNTTEEKFPKDGNDMHQWLKCNKRDCDTNLTIIEDFSIISSEI